MYILKSIKPETVGMYVGSRLRGRWPTKCYFEADIQKARVFKSISGIKNFHGTVYNTEKYNAIKAEMKNNPEAYRTSKAWNDALETARVPYTEYYEALSINIKI
jgi:hypothetical protein